MKLMKEEIEDLDQRTTDVGLFMLAESYMTCAVKLIENRPRGLRFNAPLEFLIFHALELYLKSFLRRTGLSVPELASRKYGHNFPELIEAATVRGLQLRDLDIARLQFSSEEELPIQARYLITGFKQVISLEDLVDTARNVRGPVGEFLIAAGVKVREPPWISSLPAGTPG
jgi:hypothetical protein